MTTGGNDESRQLSQAVEMHKGGFYAEAKRRYAQLLTSNPGHLDALNLGGLLAFQTGEMERALDYLSKAIVLDPDFGDARYHLGLVHRARGNLPLAVVHFQRALGVNPNDPDIRIKLAETLRHLGRFAEAVAVLEDAARDSPANAGMLVELGRAYRDTGRLDDAAASFHQAIEISERLDEAEIELGNLLRLVGRFDEASAAFERAISVRPDSRTARMQLGRTLRDWGKSEEAREVFRSATEADPESPLFALFYGDALLHCGQIEPAVNFLRQAIESMPADKRLQALFGYALWQMGREEEGRQLWRRILSADVDQPDALRHLADVAENNDGLTSEAIERYRAALLHSPRNRDLLIQFSQTLLNLGEPGMAVEACDKCLQLAPGNASAIANKIIGLSCVGRHDEIRELARASRFIRSVRFTDAPGYETLEAFNRALTEHILAHPTLKYTPPEKSTRNGDHTGELRFGQPREPIDALEKMIGEAVKSYREGMPRDPGHPFLGHFPDRWGLTIWAIVMRSQGHQIPHIHPAGWLSGVYYPQVRDVIAENEGDNAGWIEFGRPPENPARVSHVDPEVTLYRPEEGLMLLFPSYIYHRTIPYDVGETRVSVAFDLFPISMAEAAERPNLADIVTRETISRPN